MEILTDMVLRAHWFRSYEKEYHLSKDTMLTPAAKDFIREHGITLVYTDVPTTASETTGEVISVQPIQTEPSEDGYQAMTMTPVPKGADGKPQYVDSRTGEVIGEKPENMTHLYGNVLVPKTHPQIAFRGMLDSLEARILSLQIMAAEDGMHRLTDALGEILDYVRHILGAEVRGTELEDICLLGLDSSGLRYESHHIKEIYGIPHPMPEYRMGRLCIALNELRTFVREAELAAARAFTKDDCCTRPDIVEAMNRLSSVIYILFCRQLTGRWPNGQQSEKDLPGFLVEASGRHVHLTQQAVDVLFGEPLHENGALSQPGQYAAKERVRLVTAKGEIDHVVVLGPVRNEVQVEMSLTDARILGIDIPVNLSGDLKGAGDIIIVGPKGIYNAPGSVIASKAHIHMTPEDAKLYGVEDGDSVAVRLETERPVTIDDVIIRVSDKFALAMHMDYDEANACSHKKGDMGYLVTERRI